MYFFILIFINNNTLNSISVFVLCSPDDVVLKLVIDVDFPSTTYQSINASDSGIFGFTYTTESFEELNDLPPKSDIRTFFIAITDSSGISSNCLAISSHTVNLIS